MIPPTKAALVDALTPIMLRREGEEQDGFDWVMDAATAILALMEGWREESAAVHTLREIAEGRWDSGLRGYDLALAAMDEIRSIRRRAAAALAAMAPPEAASEGE